MSNSSYYPKIADDSAVSLAIEQEKSNRDRWMRDILCDIEMLFGVRISHTPIHDLNNSELYNAMKTCMAMEGKFTHNYRVYLLFGYISRLLFMNKFTPHEQVLFNETDTIANVYSTYKI